VGQAELEFLAQLQPTKVAGLLLQLKRRPLLELEPSLGERLRLIAVVELPLVGSRDRGASQDHERRGAAHPQEPHLLLRKQEKPENEPFVPWLATLGWLAWD